MGKNNRNKSKQNVKASELEEVSANTSSKSNVSTTSESEVSISVLSEELTFSIAKEDRKDSSTPVDPFEEIKKAIDNSNDKMSGLQDSLSENRTRLAAMLGLGEIESSPKNDGLSPSKSFSERSALDDSEKSFQYYALEKETKEQKKLIDQLKKDKATAELAAVEKAKQLVEKTKENEKLTQDNAALTSKTNELAAVQTHIREIETHIHASCMELHEFNGTTIDGAHSSKEGGLSAAHNSKRIVVLMSLLTSLKTQLKSQTNDVVKSAQKIEELQKLVAEHKQDISDANHAIHELEEDLQKEGDKLNKQKEVSGNIITALKNQVAELKSKTGGSDDASELQKALTRTKSDLQMAEIKWQTEEKKFLEDIERLTAEKLKSQSEQLADLKKTHEELESVRKDLLSVTTQLNASTKSQTDAEAQWKVQEQQLQDQIDKLKAEANNSSKSSPKKESTSGRDIQLLEKENKELRENLSAITSSNSLATIEYTSRISELQEMLTTSEAAATKKIEELTVSLKTSTDALSSHMTAKSSDAKNSEKLIAALEAALDSSKKEIVALTTQITVLENKIADQQRSMQERKNSRSNSLVDNGNSEELVIIRKELLSKTAEVMELRERIAELSAANAKYQEEQLAAQKLAMQTEAKHNEEMLHMLSELGQLKTANASTVEGLQSRIAKLKEDRAAGVDYSPTAREAETRVAFTKEAFRAHLKANGVKVFLWDDMFSLMRKLEDLHSNPRQPIVCVAPLIEVVAADANENSPKGNSTAVPTPSLTPRKKSTITPKRSSVKKTPKRASFFGEDSETENNNANRFTPISSKASFHYGGSFANQPFGASTSATKSSAVKDGKEKVLTAWKSACVDKADPFGDLKQKTKSMKVSYKDTVARFESFKAQTPSPTSGSFYNKAGIDRFLEPNNTDSYLESIGAVVVSDGEEDDAGDTM